MKGLVVKFKDKRCKAGIPRCGMGLVANITWHSGLFWCLSGLKMPEEIHMIWRYVGNWRCNRIGSCRI